MNNILSQMYAADEINYVPDCIKNKLDNLDRSSVVFWDLAPDHDWVDEIIDKFLYSFVLESPQIRCIMQRLQMCIGKIKILYLLGTNNKDFIYFLEEAVKEQDQT